jgi:phosphoglycerol transferase MdoB-like AlkP superfamily enzyme
MTTSNHRPYTYPDKIDVPSGTGREGAVKYTDYAIGEFLRKARMEPWFDQTVFVIVADHCASSAGKTDISVDKHRIPLIIHCPKYVKPARVDSVCSQIDIAPTLLALLNMSYTSRFFGQDAIGNRPDRALVGNYLRLGFYRGGISKKLVILEPQGKTRFYAVDDAGRHTPIAADDTLLLDAISYYQCASNLLARKALTNN